MFVVLLTLCVIGLVNIGLLVTLLLGNEWSRNLQRAAHVNARRTHDTKCRCRMCLWTGKRFCFRQFACKDCRELKTYERRQ